MHFVVDHPLVQHCVSVMRSKDTPPKLFREMVERITIFLAYEALRDAPLREVRVETPIADAAANVLDARTVVVPVLRAGFGMLAPMLQILPESKVGVIGMRRDETTGNAESYYENVPAAAGGELVLLIDPMLATGGSACDAVAKLKSLGYDNIKFLNLIAAPEGILRFEREHPDVAVYTASKDRCLNSNFYIVPGLGDAGDRIFGMWP